MKKGKILLLILSLCFFTLVYYEFTHVYGTSNVQNIELPGESNNINSGIDKIDVKKMKFKKLLRIEGWAYINDLQADKQNAYIVLLSKNHRYVFDTEKVERGDLPAALNDQSNKVESSGLRSLINMSELAADTYDIAFYIENGSQKEFSLSVSGLNVIKSNASIELKEKTNNKLNLQLDEVKDKVQANIEEVKVENGIIKIKGWGFLEDVSPELSTIYVVLKEEESNKIIVYDTQTQIRKDVTAYYSKKLDLDKSGFISRINEDDLKNERYKIGLYIKNGAKAGFHWSKESIGE
ncbi:hypothetical protein [Paenibacillus sp. sgz500992]|uniref:hypothetical protein n=1 Tax=Paenibacillus sp. sgz500992 TaxID=3242476 RepID=UPI0036D3BC18